MKPVGLKTRKARKPRVGAASPVKPAAVPVPGKRRKAHDASPEAMARHFRKYV